MSKEQRKSSITNRNGVISSKKLSEVLGIGKGIPRPKTVPSPLERTTTQLPGKYVISESVSTLISRAEQMRLYSSLCYYIFHVLLNSGCRISEVISIRAVDIMANGLVRVKGAKGSNDRIINCGLATEYMMRCYKVGKSPFSEVNRKFVWSVFKKFNIELEVGSSGKKVVTHSLRHIMVASAKSANIDLNITGRFIGHKNVSNTSRYGKIKR